MSWLTPSLYEQELLASARENLPEAVITLAKFTVLAARIEPLLLRNIRIAMLPGSDPELEYQLWYSLLISARSTRNIVLHQGVAKLLADELHSSNEFEQIWDLTQLYTRHWTALDRLEQQLRFDAFHQDQAAIASGVQEVLRTIYQSTDPKARMTMARWAKKTLPTIAEETTTSQEVSWLAQYAATLLGATANWTKLSANAPLPAWLGNTTATATKHIGLRLRYDPGLAYQVLECVPVTADSITLPLPTPLPASLYIQSDQQSTGTRAVINTDSRLKISPAAKSLTLSTIDGKRYELLADFEPNQVQSFSAQPDIYLTYIEADRELAQQIALQLAEHQIEVTLLAESPGNLNSNQSSIEAAKYLRLWTPTAQQQWQKAQTDQPLLARNSLILQWQQAELPNGELSTPVINLGEMPQNIHVIQVWLTVEVTPMAESESEDVVDSLLKEPLEPEKPEIKSRDSQSFGDKFVEQNNPRKGVIVKVYLSYFWASERQNNIVDRLGELCNQRGISLIRDNQALKHGQLINQFILEKSVELNPTKNHQY